MKAMNAIRNPWCNGLPVKEYCVFAANYVWPKKSLGGESLVLVLRLEQNQKFDSTLLEDISARNRPSRRFQTGWRLFSVGPGLSSHSFDED